MWLGTNLYSGTTPIEDPDSMVTDLPTDFIRPTGTTLTIRASFNYVGTDCGTRMTLPETANIGGSSFNANPIFIDWPTMTPSVYYSITYSYFLVNLTELPPYSIVYIVLFSENSC